MPLADHAYLFFIFKIQPSLPISTPTTIPYTIIHFDYSLATTYVDYLRTLLPSLDHTTNIHEKATLLVNILWNATTNVFPYYTSSARTQRVGGCPMNNWFDEECKDLHCTYRTLLRHDPITAKSFHKIYRNTLRCKKRQFLFIHRRNMLATFRNHPKLFWRALLPRRKTCSITNPHIWFQHASNIYNVPGEPPITIPCHPSSTSSCTFFTYRNVKEAIHKLQTSRAADVDGLQSEFLKYAASTLCFPIANLFNEVIIHGFPPSWSSHLIHPIYKLGDPLDPNNYRTIMIGHTLSKLYATILDAYISSFVDNLKLRTHGQDGFRRDHQTIDHILTLRAIIEEACYNGKPVYCCFVDFRKAFDTVPRHLLFERLRALGLSDIIIQAVLRLYERVQGHFCTIHGTSPPIYNTIGVK
eukprot:Gb_38872 [translate_table: standard]